MSEPQDKTAGDAGQPAKPLTASNLEELQQQQQQEREDRAADDDEEVESYVAPQATTDERLEQARIFLSDEDVNVNQGFARRHQEIDAYVRRISDEKIPCDAQVYRDVKNMLFVHKMRMEKQRYEGNRPIDYSRLPNHSQRLGLRDTSERARFRGAPLREDHPPFTIERKPDQQDFLRAFRADTEQGRALRALEAAAYDATLVDSSLVNEYLEERATGARTEDDRTERFNIRAAKRGRRRAAVQIALRSFARNGEQHFAGGWDHRVVRLPPPPVEEPAEPIMFAPLDREQQARAIHPYRYTRKMLQFHEQQQAIEERISVKLASSEANLGYTWLDFPNPSHKHAVMRARYENRIRVLALLMYDLLVKHAAREISHGRSDESGRSNESQAATFVEDYVIPECQEVGRSDLPQQTRVRLVLDFFTSDPRWPEGYLRTRTASPTLDPPAIAALQGYIRSRSPAMNATVYTLSTRLGTELAYVWNRLKANLVGKHKSRNRQMAIDSLASYRESRYKRDEERHKTRGARAPLRDLAQPLNGDEAELTHAQAINLMSDHILRENHENRRPKRVALDEIWSFADHVPAESRNRNFFSIEQWSGFAPIGTDGKARITAAEKRKAGIDDDDFLSLSPRKRQRARDVDDYLNHPVRQYNAVAYEPLNPDNPNPSRRLPPEKIGFVQVEETPEERAPKIGSGELMPPEMKNFDYVRDGHVLENAPDMKENHQEGLPYFPFAETPFMQVLLGRQVANDMAPGSLDPAAQIIKADGTDIILPTKQFSLPQPFTDASADTLNSAGVFDQRLPSRSRKRRLSPELGTRSKPPISPLLVNDDDEGGRRGASRQRTQSPSRTRQEAEALTATKSSTEPTVRIWKQGQPILFDNGNKEPTIDTITNAETATETTSNTGISTRRKSRTTLTSMTVHDLVAETTDPMAIKSFVKSRSVTPAESIKSGDESRPESPAEPLKGAYESGSETPTESIKSGVENNDADMGPENQPETEDWNLNLPTRWGATRMFESAQESVRTMVAEWIEEADNVVKEESDTTDETHTTTIPPLPQTQTWARGSTIKFQTPQTTQPTLDPIGPPVEYSFIRSGPNITVATQAGSHRTQIIVPETQQPQAGRRNPRDSLDLSAYLALRETGDGDWDEVEEGGEGEVGEVEGGTGEKNGEKNGKGKGRRRRGKGAGDGNYVPEGGDEGEVGEVEGGKGEKNEKGKGRRRRVKGAGDGSYVPEDGDEGDEDLD